MVMCSHYKPGFHNHQDFTTKLNCFLVGFCLRQLSSMVADSTIRIPFRNGAGMTLLWLTKCSDQRYFLEKCRNFCNHYFLLKRKKSTSNIYTVLVSARIELIFLSAAAVFWIYYQKSVDNTDVSSCCYEIKAFFQSPIFS